MSRLASLLAALLLAVPALSAAADPKSSDPKVREMSKCVNKCTSKIQSCSQKCNPPKSEDPEAFKRDPSMACMQRCQVDAGRCMQACQK